MPKALRVAAAWSWRLLVVAGAVAALVWVLRPVSTIIVAVAVALLLAALLAPLVRWLRRYMGKSFAAAIGLVTGIVLVGGLLTLAVDQLVRKAGYLAQEAMEGVDQAVDWLAERLGPNVQLAEFLGDFQVDLMELLRSNSSNIASGAFSLASTAVGWVSAGLIGVFALFFYLRDGRAMWVWFLRCLPERARVPADEAGIRGWVTLGNYVRTQAQVAAIDAVGIGLGAIILGVPLAVPIAVLVFFGSFIPIVGAIFTGAVAVFVALVNNGLTSAIIMLVIVLLVQQLESNVLQPWLMSNAVSLHPLAVVLSVTCGGMIAGIPGAIFAVPLVAFLNVVIMYLHGHDMLPDLATDVKRPGGPPGSLEEQISASYRRELPQ